MKFDLTIEEQQKINKWKLLLPHIEDDVFGKEYSYEYIFKPTGLGVVKIIERSDGQKLDITDYDKW